MINNKNAITKIISMIFILSIIISCKIDTEDGRIKLQKEEFKQERIINLNDSNKYDTFRLEVNYGEVRLEKGKKFDLKIKVYEEIENDVNISIRNGKVIGKSDSNKKFAIGDVTGTIPTNSSIEVDSGSGDVMIRGFDNKFINIDTGAGNVILSDCICKKELDIDTGAGNISINNTIAQTINVDAGAGNISLTEVEADNINCDSGIGNISVFNSKALLARFDTGIGNVSTVDCNFEDKNFSTRLGKVRDSESINNE